ncbi:hypothetical protein LCGC14_3136420 [marine sediment metagenome]|uniref:HNH nuclease domain-containing protein n=1 Tax=marine sediment metagenome TaxID=412755 RepID=A0A0F8YMH3_9ZZZZ
MASTIGDCDDTSSIRRAIMESFWPEELVRRLAGIPDDMPLYHSDNLEPAPEYVPSGKPPGWGCNGYGEQNSNWRGDKATVLSGRDRARRMYPVPKPCTMCGEKGERHHKDGNTLNNEPINIDWLCRRHHMMADGRSKARNPLTGRPIKTHCPHGHPYDSLNTYYRRDNLGRGCRACRIEAVKMSRERRKGRRGA